MMSHAKSAKLTVQESHIELDLFPVPDPDSATATTAGHQTQPNLMHTMGQDKFIQARMQPHPLLSARVSAVKGNSSPQSSREAEAHRAQPS